ncbi:MAG: MFS transporter [Bacteroidetes bacterium]|nr:MFS transporter [Bacteroidota bacterium]
MTETTQQKIGWKFPKEFWLANFMELCERAAYYGFFIVLTLYLTDLVGFTDTETGVVAGVFYAGLYFLPPFAGAVSDKIGFKNGLILAFALLTIGYALLGMFHTKMLVLFFLFIVLVGGSFIKPLITGTVAKTTNEDNRARGYALFYWIVNIGSFSGKTLVPYIRQGVGVEYVNFFSAGMSLLAMFFAIFFYKQSDRSFESKKISDVVLSLKKILLTPRLLFLILIVSGFWIIQQQLYATMPKYVIRLRGNEARPEWLANINPAVVVLFVVLVTNMMKKRKAVTSMFVGMILMPLSAFAMSFSQTLESFAGSNISIFGVLAFHPITLMLIIGIAIQGLAECFISPRFLEYFSFQAPKGEEGVYLGFSHMHSFISALVGFIMSGFLLDKYCPDPKTLPAGLTEIQRAAYYANAHLIWYYFLAIGFAAAIALFIFKIVTERIDKRKEVIVYR